jgi:hypothetical protein
METMVPKLVAEDIPLLNSLLSDVFPGVAYVPAEMTKLREEIAKVCREMYLVYSEAGSEEIGGQWVEKVFLAFFLSCTRSRSISGSTRAVHTPMYDWMTVHVGYMTGHSMF